MELTFEHSQKVADGANPAAYHTPDNQIQVLFTDGGLIKSTYTDTPMGEFDDRDFTTPYTVSADTSVEHLRVTYLPRMNVFWTWESDIRHRMAMMVLKQDGSPYLENGTISFQEADAGAGLSLTLNNPDGIFSSEYWAGVTPGTRINVFCQFGDSARYQIGQFYVDKIDYEVGNPLVPIQARNIVGKLLKDQTLDENYMHLNLFTEDFFADMLRTAGLSRYSIQAAEYPSVYTWPRDKTYFDAITEAMTPLPDWRMREKADGEIVIGAPAYSEFTEGTFSFTRNEDCISRKVLRDDQNAYSRVCVHYKTRWEETVGTVPVEGENLGTGDDTETTFLTANAPMESAWTVYFDDVEQTTGVTVDTTIGEVVFGTAPANDVVITIDYTARQAKVNTEYMGEKPTFAEDLETTTNHRPIREGTVEVWAKDKLGRMIDITGMASGAYESEPWYTLNLTTGAFTADYLIGDYYLNYETDISEIVEQTDEEFYYDDVDFQPRWNMPMKKTAYVELPENTDEADALAVLAELIVRYAKAGIIEVFVARFTPHLQPGDTAEITDGGTVKEIGIVTDVTHRFGKGGFLTEFTVDASGLQGKPKISDYIEKVTNKQTQFKGLYREIT